MARCLSQVVRVPRKKRNQVSPSVIRVLRVTPIGQLFPPGMFFLPTPPLKPSPPEGPTSSAAHTPAPGALAGHCALVWREPVSKHLHLHKSILSQFVHIFSVCIYPCAPAGLWNGPSVTTHNGRGHVTLVSPEQALNNSANKAWSVKVHRLY